MSVLNPLAINELLAQALFTAVKLLLFNSHDRSTAFSISAGIYRFVCANSLVIADSMFESYKIKHIGDKNNYVLAAINNITAFKPQLEQLPLRFEEHLEVDYNNLIIPHHSELDIFVGEGWDL